MDFMDYVELDHASYRHNDSYLDRLEHSRSEGSPSWTKEEKIAWHRRQMVSQMPCLPEEEEPELDQPETVGPVVTKWVRRGHIMRFHPEEFFQERLIALKPGAELYDADAIPYYIDDGSGNPLCEYYGRRAPEDFTVYTSDIDE